MSSVSNSFAFSYSFNLNNTNQTQNFAPQPFTNGNPMSGMMQGFGMLFAGMDMIDNGQMDGSLFQMLAGGQPQQAQGNMPVPYQPQGFPQQAQTPFGQPQQAGGMPFGNNPMMAMLMQMMQMMMFGMMDLMDDGQMNGSARNMMGQQGGFPGAQPMNFGSPSAMAGLYNNNGGAFASAAAGPNGAFASAGAGTGSSNSLTNAMPAPGSTRNPGAGNFGGKNLTQEQVNNARIIAEVGKQRGASKRDIAIAIATAMQESSLKNINYGDRDSVGLFQQRPSCGWGTVAQCTDPRYAANKFYDHLLKDSNRHNKSLTKAAQDVQRSAYPNAYAKWENMAVSLTNSIC